MSSLALVITCVLAASDGGSTAEQRARALALYKQKQYAEACELFEQLTKAEPGDASLWSDTGLCLIRRGNPISEHALEALLEAWKLASASSDKGAVAVRRAALFNMNLYFGNVETGTAKLEDPRCPGKGLALSGLHTSLSVTPRSYGEIRHLQVCALGDDGNCVEEKTSQISLGGYFGDADALPMPYCYPEAQEKQACVLLEDGRGISAALHKKIKRTTERARKEGDTDEDVCAALQTKFGPAFEKAVKRVSDACNNETEETRQEIMESRASYPQCRLIDVDVCASRVTARCGKKELTFTPGEQPEALGEASGH